MRVLKDELLPLKIIVCGALPMILTYALRKMFQKRDDNDYLNTKRWKRCAYDPGAFFNDRSETFIPTGQQDPIFTSGTSWQPSRREDNISRVIGAGVRRSVSL
jgi:hypothetical protein